MGWDTGLKNIRENTVITAQYRKKKCTVIFVDWDNTSLNIKEFKYGDVLTLDSLPEKEGQKFDKWTDANGKEVTTVTDNMVVAASYKDTKYVVTFLDWDGKVLSEQEVAYGESATLPENLKAPGDGKVFDSWDKKDEAGFVRKSIVDFTDLQIYRDNNRTSLYGYKRNLPDGSDRRAVLREAKCGVILSNLSAFRRRWSDDNRRSQRIPVVYSTDSDYRKCSDPCLCKECKCKRQ